MKNEAERLKQYGVKIVDKEGTDLGETTVSAYNMTEADEKATKGLTKDEYVQDIYFAGYFSIGGKY